MRTTIFAASLLLATAGAASASSDSVSHHFNASTSRGAVRHVVVDVPAGTVHIRNGAADKIVADGSVRREYGDETDRIRQQRVVDDIGVEIYVSNDGAMISRRLGDHARGWSARNNSDYELNLDVTPGMDVDIRTKAGEVHLDGSFGSINVDLRAGEIHANVARANVRDLNASVRIGEVHANTGEQQIENEGILPHEVHWVNPNGGTAKIDLHTTVGEVHVKLTP